MGEKDRQIETRLIKRSNHFNGWTQWRSRRALCGRVINAKPHLSFANTLAASEIVFFPIMYAKNSMCKKKKQFNSINKTVGENVYDMYDRMTHLKDIFTIPWGHRRRFVNDSEATQLTLAGQWQYAACSIFWLLSYYTPIQTIHFFNCWEVIKRCTYS